MADTFHKNVPKALINRKLSLHTGRAQMKVELSLKSLTVGDFSNAKESRPLSERENVNPNKNNLNNKLLEFNPEANLTVPNTLADDCAKESVRLSFSGMKDFEPEQVARQYPQFSFLHLCKAVTTAQPMKSVEPWRYKVNSASQQVEYLKTC